MSAPIRGRRRTPIGAGSREPAEKPLRLGQLENAVPYHLHLAQAASFAAFAEAVGGAHLRPGWYSVLRVIGDRPGVRATDISRTVWRDKSTVTAVLRALEREGLIVRSRSEGDRRAQMLRLTAAGRSRLAELSAAARAHQRRMDAIVGRDKETLLVILRRISESLGTRWARDRPSPGRPRPLRRT